MRKIKSENKLRVTDELVDRIIDMHRGRVGINVSEFKKEVIRRNQEFDEVAKSGDLARAVELRKETLNYVLDVDMRAVKSIMALNPPENDILYKVAKQKLTLMNNVAGMAAYEGEEVFAYMNVKVSETPEYGNIADHIIEIEKQCLAIEASSICQTRIVCKGYINHLINKELPRTNEELEMIEMIYNFLKDVNADTEADMFEYVVKDLEDVPVTEVIKLGYELGLFTEKLVLDIMAGASLAINNFSKSNPILEAVRTAKATLGEMFNNLDLETDTFKDVVGESLSLRDKIKDAASLQEHLNTSRVVAAMYKGKFKHNIMVAKGYKAQDRVQTTVLDTNVQYCEYGLAKVLDALVYCICGEEINAKAILASIVFNLLSVRIQSDREICRGTEVLAKGMEVVYCSDEWNTLAEKIGEYVKDFDVPDFDASVYTSEKVEEAK